MAMKTYRVIIDQSTFGTKALLTTIEESSSYVHLVDRVDKAHRQLYPQQGWVEHDPYEILDNVKQVIDELLKRNQLIPSNIKSLSITNQRESVLIWDRETGELYTNVMVWKCHRGIDVCEELIDNGYGEIVRKKTGLRIDPYFSAPKLKWFFDHHTLSHKQLETLGVGTMDTWLLWQLTNHSTYVSDISNACRTMLFNIVEQEWDEELATLFHVPISALPQVVTSVYDFGTYLGIPIVSVLADSQAALFGNLCLSEGEAKATLGTGSSVLMNRGPHVGRIGDNILTTIAWETDGVVTYALEGVIRSFGDILNWQKDSLHLFDSFDEADQLAFSLFDNEGVYLIPALEGLGAPFWEPHATASFVGMSRRTTTQHLVRAGFEAMAFQIRAVIDEFEETGAFLQVLHVDGGASKNTNFMQLLADITRKEIVSGVVEELSAMGTLAILGETINPKKITDKVYVPIKNYESSYDEWRKKIKIFLEA